MPSTPGRRRGVISSAARMAAGRRWSQPSVTPTCSTASSRQRRPIVCRSPPSTAPTYRCPLAAIDGVGHVQTFMSIAPKGSDGKPDLVSALTRDELKVIADGILDACADADGVKDGMVQAVKACKFDPAVLACKPEQNSACLPE